MDLNYRKKARIMILTAVIVAVILFAAGAAMAFSGEVGSTYEVSDAGMIVYGPGDGGYSNSKKTDLGDGLGARYSYCIQPQLDTPVVSTIKIDRVLGKDAGAGQWGALRKTVYYSPSYPGYEQNVNSVKSAYYTGDFTRDWGIAHLAMSYIYAGRPSDLDTYLGTKASALGDVWTKAKALGDAMYASGTSWDSSVPGSFKVFLSRTAGYQGMAVGYMEPPGSVSVRKKSAGEAITSGNMNYSLAGAVYTVFDENSQPVKEIRLNETGESGQVTLPAGSYAIKETAAPKGFAADVRSYPVVIVSNSTYSLDVKDEPIVAEIETVLKKNPAGFGYEHGEGDAKLEGAVYSFSYIGKETEEIKGKTGDAGNDILRTWYFTTDGKGEISGKEPSFADGFQSDELYRDADGKTVFPLGKYLVKEVRSSEGYLKDESDLLMEVSEDGTGSPRTTAVKTAVSEEKIVRGGVRIYKTDAQLGGNVPQGDAELSGAEFAVINRSEAEVAYEGRVISPGETVMTVITDGQGIAATSADALPYGTYSVKEIKAPEGYLLNDTWEQTFSIRKNGEIADITEMKAEENVMRSGLRIVKLDGELMKSEALGGATLEGIVLTIRNVSEKSVLVRTEPDDRETPVNWNDRAETDRLLEEGKLRIAAPGEDIGTLTIRWNEEKKAYTAETRSDDLPYGTYSIRETETNSSYQRSDRSEHIIELRENGRIYSYDEGHGEILSFKNYVYRSDVRGTKIGDSTSERFSFVPFAIKSMTNGETHVVVTDRNGLFSTADRRTADELEECEGGSGERKVNPFDDLLGKEDITNEELQEREKDIRMGVWFGTEGSGTEQMRKAGALPYDTYILEELSCEKNRGYSLQRFIFTVDEKSLNGTVDLETITDDIPEIETYAEVSGKKTGLKVSDKTVLTDTVKYTGLMPGETYVVKGRLMDSATGLALKDPDGNEIVSQREFKAKRGTGKVKVEFSFDASGLEGKSTVVFERLYDSKGHIMASHEDISDEGQTVTWEKKEETPEKEIPVKEEPKKEVPKKDVPKTKVPKTGDTGGLAAWTALFAVSGITLTAVRRKEKKTRL